MSSPKKDDDSNSRYEIEVKDGITSIKNSQSFTDESLSTDQEKEFLRLEEMFAFRYTDKDDDYMATVNFGIPDPPFITSYRPFWKRRHDDRSEGVKRQWNDQRRDNSYNRHQRSYDNKRPRDNYNYHYRR